MTLVAYLSRRLGGGITAPEMPTLSWSDGAGSEALGSAIRPVLLTCCGRRGGGG
jgi:hypothetical protein